MKVFRQWNGKTQRQRGGKNAEGEGIFIAHDQHTAFTHEVA